MEGNIKNTHGEFPVKENGTGIKAKYETEEGKISYEAETQVNGIVERTEPWVNIYRYPKNTKKKVGSVGVVLSSNKSGQNLMQKIDEEKWQEYKRRNNSR